MNTAGWILRFEEELSLLRSIEPSNSIQRAVRAGEVTEMEWVLRVMKNELENEKRGELE